MTIQLLFLTLKSSDTHGLIVTWMPCFFGLPEISADVMVTDRSSWFGWISFCEGCSMAENEHLGQLQL